VSAAFVIGAALRFFAAFVWGVLAYQSWVFHFRHRPRHPLLRLIPILASVVSLAFFSGTLFWFVPPDQYEHPPLAAILVYIVADLSTLAAVAVFRHLVWYLPEDRTEPPTRAWLAATYGASGAVAVLTLFFDLLIPLPTHAQRLAAYRSIYVFYQIACIGLGLRETARVARRGMWRPGGSLVMRQLDVGIVMGGALALGIILALLAWRRGNLPMALVLGLDVVIAVTFTMPVVARILGYVLHSAIVFGGTMASAGALFLGGRALVGPTPEVAVGLGLVLGVVAMVSLLQPWLRATADQLVFRLSQRRRLDLQVFLHTLSPELGVVECCRRALGELARVMQAGGVGIILRSGERVAHGAIDLAPIVHALLPGGDTAVLPPRMAGDLLLRELPPALREATIAAQIVAVVPLTSPRGCRGHIFISGRSLVSSFGFEDVQAIEAFADQLALLLDGAELLARALAVERSLAHAEKLAAIGETAARIAHDIRNPVAAARSLAQQLAREPASPFRDEHEVILGELARVERLVADLLRFARREELRLEPVELGGLVRATIEHFGPSLQASGIAVRLDGPEEVIARGDPEKLRQVLINLLENAIDALRERPGRRAIMMAVGNGRAAATLGVSDTGPGVPAEAHPRLFEPFFSLKEHGTGLGLAIARRTIEAHGGRITAEPGTEGGLAFHIELPLAEDPAA
jgi:signal transduction histidine kinase